MTDKKNDIDWQEIERDFKAGTMGIRELARWYGISDTAIRKRAKQHGWGDNPHRKRSHTVRTNIAPRTEPVLMSGIDATRPENIVGYGRNLIIRLLEELDTVTTSNGELQHMIDCEEDDERRKQALRKAVDLPGRANVIKALATAFKTFNETAAVGGKKAQRQERADNASSEGKYAVRSAPKLVVDNK